MSFDLIEKRPADCTDSELRAFCDLVKLGDEVDPHGLEGRVRSAWLLAFGSVDGRLAAVAGIKRPNENYRAGVFQKSGSKLAPKDFPVELGWLMVDEQFRRKGYGRRVTDGLLGSLGQNVYTTSRSTMSRCTGCSPLTGSGWLANPGALNGGRTTWFCT